MDTVIHLEDVTYEYARTDGEETPALCAINLDIARGSFVCIIGHNGSGKSTLAKLLNGLFLPSSGKVEVMGMDTASGRDIWNIRQKCGLVLQNPDNQLVATVVEEDVAFGPENMGVASAEIRRRVDAALDAVGMRDRAKSAPHMLSGGQKQRVAIAGILAMRPEIIVLDEPTAMLDPSGRREVLETVHRLNRQEGITVVLITHFMNEAVDADRVIVMDDGRIVMDDAPRQVFAQVEALQAIALDVPTATELAHALEKRGVTMARTPIGIEELVEAICQS
nr:energy-coupling factor transporter ATPase [Maliibacterium massiliense]